MDELLHGLLAGQRLLGHGLLGHGLLGGAAAGDPATLVEQVAGINSQAARALHLGLAARGLPDPLPACDAALADHGVVRANLTRGTLRTVSAADYRAWRPALQPVLERVTRGFLGRRLAEMPLDAVLAEARQLLAEKPLNRADLGRALAARLPDHAGDGAGKDGGGKDLAFAARMLLPLVQEPAAGRWEPQRRPRYLLAEQVLGPIATDADAVDAGLGSLLHRYLGAFGPATLADFRAWSGVSAAEAKRALALLPEREERVVDGVAYLSAPSAAPEPSDPPAVLLLPPFDDVLFAHADRGRVASREQLKRLVPPAVEMPGIVLVHGRAAGRWRHRPAQRAADQATLEVHLFPEVPAPGPELTAATGALASLLASDGRAPEVVVDRWPR